MIFSRAVIAVSVFSLLGAAGPAGAAHEVTQTIELQPGWNSIFLEVQPASNDTVSVFNGLPISSVWTWIPKDGSAQLDRKSVV